MANSSDTRIWEGLSDVFMQTWHDLDIYMTEYATNGTLDLGTERPMVSFIAAPTPDSAVAEAVYRWRIECAVRGIPAFA